MANHLNESSPYFSDDETQNKEYVYKLITRPAAMFSKKEYTSRHKIQIEKLALLKTTLILQQKILQELQKLNAHQQYTEMEKESSKIEPSAPIVCVKTMIH